MIPTYFNIYDFNFFSFLDESECSKNLLSNEVNNGKIIDYIELKEDKITEVIFEEGMCKIPTNTFNLYLNEIKERGYEYAKSLEITLDNK